MIECITAAVLAVTTGTYALCAPEPAAWYQWELVSIDIGARGKSYEVFDTPVTDNNTVEVECAKPGFAFRGRYQADGGAWSGWSQWIPCLPDYDVDGDGRIDAHDFFSFKRVYGSRLRGTAGGAWYVKR